MIKDLRKAALGYVLWKQNQSHFRKPWRFPEDITVPRILITDCWDSSNPTFTVSTPSAPSTPIAQPRPSKIASIQNGDTIPSLANSSPLSQKKSKKKFKFKFDKWDDKKVKSLNVHWINFLLSKNWRHYRPLTKGWIDERRGRIQNRDIFILETLKWYLKFVSS